MLNDKILETLKIVYEKLKDSNVTWILSGSTSLVLQGVDVDIKDDIDILTDKDGIIVIDNLLSEFREKSLGYSSNDRYKSYFEIYKVNGIKVEVMGEFQYRLLNGEWSKPNQLNETIKGNYYGMEILMLTLEQELIEYENVCRYDKVEKIKMCLLKKGNNVL